MHSDNRKSVRIHKELSATAERVATSRHDNESRFVPIKIVDVSHGGVGFTAPEVFDSGAFVRVVVALNSDDGKAATGRIFSTLITIRNCNAEQSGGFRIHGSYRVGALVKGQTTKDIEAWHELIRKWGPKVM